MTGRSDRRPLVRTGLRTWFFTPPRQHGDVEYSREVSFLELFYDLVYVVVIGQAAHHLADHVGWAGASEFAMVFGLIWLAWFNGTMWHELHGREDGRSRNNIFAQMGLLCVLAVFAGGAAGDDGSEFAVVYAILFAWFTWQWFVVYRIDEDPRYRPNTRRYLAGMVTTVVAVALSAVAGETVRHVIWSVVVIGWLVGGVALMASDRSEGFGDGVTRALVERVGLLTILVLGEVVIGVVDGIGDAEERRSATLGLGIACLAIGMGVWWNYFDLLGRRVPTRQGPRLAAWLYAHLPMTASIAGAGAAMVSVIEHAGASRTPPATAWMLGGAVATALASIAVATSALPSDAFPSGVARSIPRSFTIAIVVVLLAAAARPSPWVLILVVNGALLLTWLKLLVTSLAGSGRPLAG